MFSVFISCTVTERLILRRLDAAGFIRPKIKISFPVGRGVHAQRGSYEACTKKKRKERRAILQTTRLVLLLSVAVKNSTECYFNTTTEHWISSGTIRLCLVIFNYFFLFFFFYPRVFTCIREVRWLSLLKSPVLQQPGSTITSERRDWTRPRFCAEHHRHGVSRCF